MKTSIDPKTNESSWKKFSLLHIKVMYSKAGPRLNEKNDCDCVNTSHLVTILTTTTILFFLTSVMMLFFTINFYKKSKILLETTCKNRNISTNKHKINSFTCLGPWSKTNLPFEWDSRMRHLKNWPFCIKSFSMWMMNQNQGSFWRKNYKKFFLSQ